MQQLVLIKTIVFSALHKIKLYIIKINIILRFNNIKKINIYKKYERFKYL